MCNLCMYVVGIKLEFNLKISIERSECSNILWCPFFMIIFILVSKERTLY